AVDVQCRVREVRHDAQVARAPQQTAGYLANLGPFGLFGWNDLGARPPFLFALGDALELAECGVVLQIVAARRGVRDGLQQTVDVNDRHRTQARDLVDVPSLFLYVCYRNYCYSSAMRKRCSLNETSGLSRF